MKYQLSFERLGRVHWVFCDNRKTLLLLWDSLKVGGGNKHFECLENPYYHNRRGVTFEELEASEEAA